MEEREGFSSFSSFSLSNVLLLHIFRDQIDGSTSEQFCADGWIASGVLDSLSHQCVGVFVCKSACPFWADDWMATRCLSDAWALIFMSVSVYISCVCAGNRMNCSLEQMEMQVG